MCWLIQTDTKHTGLSQVTVLIFAWCGYNLEKLPEFENSLNTYFPLQHNTDVKLLLLGTELKLRGSTFDKKVTSYAHYNANSMQ